MTLLERARTAPVTYGLAALNVIVFVVLEAEHAMIMNMDVGTLLDAGANEPLHVWVGEYWRVLTYMFLHVGWLHLVWNIYASVGFCAAVEGALGRGRFLGVYLLSGIGGGCTSAIFGHAVSAGASGALFGIVGAMLALRRRSLPSFAAFFRDPPTRSILVNIGIWTVIGSTALAMDNAAHFGGLLVGFGATWMMTARRVGVWSAIFGAAFAALLVTAARPWHVPTPGEVKTMTEFAVAYAEGGRGVEQNKARGHRFARKACAAGSATACEIARETNAQ
ncbi:MAG: rhomboid family intramembrane serine protease [Polyangiaceae bacterium]|nr:rhomboid family intramembrane serine protease [Polyangiaceae bacterium]